MLQRLQRLKAALIAGASLAIGAAAASAGVSPAQPAVPPGCTLGIAGPALRPATSLREARDAAFAALAAERLPLQLTSEVSWHDARVREISDERVTGVLRGVRIAGLRGHPDGRIDVLACGPEVAGRPPGRGWRRAWPRGLPRRAGCALGIAGEDIDTGARERAARRDALEMLAREREAEVRHELIVHGGRRVTRDHGVRASEAARAATAELEDELIEARWLDRAGRGPLGRAGVLYLELCFPEPPEPSDPSDPDEPLEPAAPRDLLERPGA